MIDLVGVSKHYQIGPVEVRALDGVDLHVSDGEFVVVLGPSGSGKELIAQALHQHSPRAHRQFVPLNVAAIPGELIESELFESHEHVTDSDDTDKHGGPAVVDGADTDPAAESGPPSAG